MLTPVSFSTCTGNELGKYRNGMQDSYLLYTQITAT